ncbi:uncharacterized protein METZ01_LOCUS487873 [marine metagenome]|jgi:hypothetical protein|uniref:Uncharacterized protein n=1 Tax=marine metagenome TaxID=408172 RepID=A0A383CSI7_9ZZZZ|tara:strand:+ start:132 stop:512 length:381 start_codon:yes stop_codon:yes gene_type:complete
MGDKISDFELKFQSSTQRQDGDNLVVDVNWATESDHEIYGAAFCTTTFKHDINDPDADSGEVTMAGQGMLSDGTRVIGLHKGTWQKAGVNKFKLSLRGRDSRDGDVYSESQMALETMTWSGTVYKA